MGKYFNIGEAWNDLKNSYGAGETAIAAIKLVGKGLSNTAVYGVTEALPSMAKEAARKNSVLIEEKLENDTSLSSEERRILEKKKTRADIYFQMSDLKDKVKDLKSKISSEEITGYDLSEINKKIANYEDQISNLKEKYNELDSESNS